MPLYEYEHDQKAPKGCEERFEELQLFSAKALTQCPVCAKKVHRVISAAHGIVDRMSGSALREKGFTKLVRRDKGVYERE